MVVSLPKRGIEEGTARSFKAKVRGQIFQGFAVRKGDQYHAYQNLCRHLPVTLDLDDNQFFTHDKQHLQCHMHGAMYEIDTGYCFAGPCQGAKLLKLEVVEEESRLVIRIPPDFASK